MDPVKSFLAFFIAKSGHYLQFKSSFWVSKKGETTEAFP